MDRRSLCFLLAAGMSGCETDGRDELFALDSGDGSDESSGEGGSDEGGTPLEGAGSGSGTARSAVADDDFAAAVGSGAGAGAGSGSGSGSSSTACSSLAGQSCTNGQTTTCIDSNGASKTLCCRCDTTPTSVIYTWQTCLPSSGGFPVP